MTVTADVGGTRYNSRLYYRGDRNGNADENDCIVLELRIKANIRTPPPGTYVNPFRGSAATYVTVTECSDAQRRQYQTRFTEVIYRYWNDKLWCTQDPFSRLTPEGSRTRGWRVTPSGIAHDWDIKCKVHIEFVADRDDAHLNIDWYKGVTDPDARESCELGGLANRWYDTPTDMRLFDDSLDGRYVSLPVAAGGNQTFMQCPAAHEFGHYLGLDHTCVIRNGARRAENSDGDYCIGTSREQMDNLMACGNRISVEHAWPWRSRIVEHNYRTGGVWRGLTAPPPPHATR